MVQSNCEFVGTSCTCMSSLGPFWVAAQLQLLFLVRPDLRCFYTKPHSRRVCFGAAQRNLMACGAALAAGVVALIAANVYSIDSKQHSCRRDS